MENASKALIMAGGVLIGLLLVSLAVFLFADFGSTAAEINARRTQTQIAEFNARFTAYEGNDLSGNRKKWTIYDVVTVLGYAKENNEYYIDNLNEYGVTVTLTGYFGGIQDIDGQRLLQEVIETLNTEGIEPNSRIYICNVIANNPNGRVSQVNFIKQP